MKAIYTLLIVAFFATPSIMTAQCPQSFHDFTAVDIHGIDRDLSEFAGKKVLVVNTASYCGYTNQYASLQELYETYGGSANPYNFEIIGFPANNFMNQEPHGEDSIISVCDSYGVTFTMMSKISVKGADIHPVYDWLTKLSKNCVQNAEVSWNFQKFLINPDGSWSGVKTPATSPLHSSIVNWITATSSVGENLLDTHTFNAFYSTEENQIKVNITGNNPQDITINLLAVNGQLIKSVSYQNASNIEFAYGANALSSGLYIAEVRGSSILERQKIIIP